MIQLRGRGDSLSLLRRSLWLAVERTLVVGIEHKHVIQLPSSSLPLHYLSTLSTFTSLLQVTWLSLSMATAAAPPRQTFLDLPAEIHLQILKYLDIPSTFCLRLANRHMYQLISPIPKPQLADHVKTAIRQQLYEKMCTCCRFYRAPGAFPHLIGSSPDKAISQDGLKGWLKRVKQARENKQGAD